MVQYCVLITCKHDKKLLFLYWLTGTTSCWTSLKTIVVKSKLILSGIRTSAEFSKFNQDAGQLLHAQKGDVSSMVIPKKQSELCEVVYDLVDRDYVTSDMMSPAMMKRLKEIETEESLLIESSGLRPTPARMNSIKADSLIEPMDEDEEDGENGAQRRVVQDTDDEDDLFNGFSKAEGRIPLDQGGQDPR